MGRSTYSPNDLGNEVTAPWGYYEPLEAGSLEYAGRRVLYTLGSACIEASCCGKGSWSYARVEGYAVGVSGPLSGGELQMGPVEVETVEDTGEQLAITKLLMDKHPGVRAEFR
jgi:hypothetical protein